MQTLTEGGKSSVKWITYTSRASIATYIHPQLYRFTMAEDEAVTYVYNPALKDKVPEAVQKALRI